MATIKNTADLQAQAAANLPDNTSQDISPQDVREMAENNAVSAYNKLTDEPIVGLKAYNASFIYESGTGCTFGGAVYIANKTTTLGAFAPADWDVVAGGGATNLAWDAVTRTVSSDTGTDAIISLFTSTEAGLVPLSGGVAGEYLEADGTWSIPSGVNIGNSNLTLTGNRELLGGGFSLDLGTVADALSDFSLYATNGSVTKNIYTLSSGVEIKTASTSGNVIAQFFPTDLDIQRTQFSGNKNVRIYNDFATDGIYIQSSTTSSSNKTQLLLSNTLGAVINDVQNGLGLGYNDYTVDEANVGAWGTADNHIPSEARIIANINTAITNDIIPIGNAGGTGIEDSPFQITTSADITKISGVGIEPAKNYFSVEQKLNTNGTPRESYAVSAMANTTGITIAEDVNYSSLQTDYIRQLLQNSAYHKIELFNFLSNAE
jgi:hypothetical protein